MVSEHARKITTQKHLLQLLIMRAPYPTASRGARVGMFESHWFKVKVIRFKPRGIWWLGYRYPAVRWTLASNEVL
ncbi:hypothetical protein BDR04DRAFT_1104400, partial [Suillus decipiens]